MLQVGNPKESCLTVITEREDRTDKIPYSFPERYQEEYAAEFHHLLDAVEGGNSILYLLSVP